MQASRGKNRCWCPTCLAGTPYVVAVCVCEDARRTMSLLSRRVMSVEHLRGLAGRLTTIERALHQLTYNALATSTY